MIQAGHDLYDAKAEVLAMAKESDLESMFSSGSFCWLAWLVVQLCWLGGYDNTNRFRH